MITRARMLLVLAGVFIAGWLLGSAYPITLWPDSDCHRLGGALRVTEGPGKPTECVIAWRDH